MKKLTVLSLFDGISCGHLALDRAGFQVQTYYASEIDKYAIQVTQRKYPDTIQLGDVTQLDFTQFEGKIDLLIGGSPCQDLSIAGNRKGIYGERSSLFFEYVRALKECKPKYFLFENNYRMQKEAEALITKSLGLDPILMDSSLVSAQQRKRLYWTNIPQFDLPESKNLVLKDIVEEEVEDKYYMNPAFTLIPKQSLKASKEISDSSQGTKIQCLGELDMRGPSQIRRVYALDGLAPTLDTAQGGHRQPKILRKDGKIRKLTPLEYERLQTLPDNYTGGLSNAQRYKCIGNGWTVDIIVILLSGLTNYVNA
jgi:DNA (cytosine-5)-methyltransferase 3A